MSEIVKLQANHQPEGDEGTEGGTDRPWSSVLSIFCGAAA
jgi:hypothetical protein